MAVPRLLAGAMIISLVLGSGVATAAQASDVSASRPAVTPPDGYAGLDGLADLFAEQSADNPGPAAQAESAVESGAEAGLTAERSGSLAEEFAAKVGDESFNFLFDFGLDALMKAVFGDPQANGFQSLENEIAIDFQQTMAQLIAIETSLKNLSGQISSTLSAAANTQCATAMNQASSYVTVIQNASQNFESMMNTPWVRANLTSTSAVQDMNTVGVQIFGGNSGSPKFLSGLNSVLVATQNLSQLLTSDAGSAAQGLVEACADSTASNIAVGLNLVAGAPPPLSVGLAESTYFGTLQTIVGYYASYVNIGRGLTTLGSQLAMGVTMVPPPATIAAVTEQCAGKSASGSPGVMTCAGILTFNDQIQENYTTAWHATGAGWAQLTDGYAATALGFNPSTGYFANGNVAWVTDIAKANRSSNPLNSLANPQYAPRANNTLLSQSALATLGGWGANEPAPASGSYSPANPVFVNAGNYAQAGLALPAFASNSPLQNFITTPPVQKALSILTPATSSHWNGLLNNNNPAVTTNNQSCFVNASSDLTSCLSSSTVGSLMARTGLMNDGQGTPASFANLLLYTGETGTWSVSQDTTAFGFYGAWQNTSASAQVKYPYANDVRVLSYLDTNITPNTGFSVVFNDPSGVNGTMGVNTIYPFFAGATNANGSYTSTAATNTTYSAGFYPVATRGAFYSSNYASGYLCSSGPSNWTPMLLSMVLGSKDSPYTGQVLQSGQSLAIKCGSAGSPANWGGTPGTMPFTGNSAFYQIPQLSLSQYKASGAYVSCQSADAVVDCNASDFAQSPGFFLNGTPNYAQADVNGLGIPAVNGNPTALSPQTQYTWPVVDLNPSTAPCRLTTFSQGSSGNIGVPQACAPIFNTFAAANWGADIGSVNVFLNPNTSTPNGSQVIARTINESGAPIKGALAVSFAQVRTSKGLNWTTSTPGASVGTCATSFSTYFPSRSGKQNMLVCTVTIPPGGASFAASIPAAATGGNGSTLAQPASVLFSNAAGTQVSGSAKTLTTAPVQLPLPPGPVTGLSAAASSGNQVTLTWDTPLQNPSIPAITQYSLNASGANGQTSSQTIPLSQVTITGTTATASATLPASGLWTISLAAQNSDGTGPPGTTVVAIGTAKPTAPANLVLIERAGGGVEFSWTPTLANPPVDNYVIQATSPLGVKSPVVSVQQANALLPTPSLTGTWTYSVYAVNALGNGPASTATINIQGGVPNPVAGLVASADAIGHVNVTFSGAPGTVPAPTSYTVALYAPGQYATPVAQAAVPSAGSVNSYTINGLYQFGRTSPAGAYVVVAMPTNAFGNGYLTYSPIYLTSSYIRTLDRVTAINQEIVGTALDLQALERKACIEGRADAVTYLTGICLQGTWTRR